MTDESLFLAALEIEVPAEREAFLKDACGTDAVQRARVQLLLEADARARGILDRRVEGGPRQTMSFLPGEQSGACIAGRYKLLEEIGEGGMGTVWVAEQTEPVRRKVALKLIKAGMDSKSVLARFEVERQALAVMDHPNIAKVLDGGLTDDHRPFFVMEYVKGVPITEYCDSARLGVAERLGLFVQVCQAVQHAHQKGIIHRDLKPSNILVAPYDDKPVPKVIDFGLAKAMHQSLTERTLHTAHETVLGTPLYMSPEQAQLNNLDVDTRSDVYSLGVLLYELLTGTTPLEKRRFKEAAWEEIKRIIREEEPPRPSTRLSSSDMLASLAAGRHSEPAKLTKLVRGELDWIVMKALEKDRTRRYETANGFAMDVQRYLAGEPVTAAPPSTRYRFQKFVRRHRAALTTTAAIILLLAAGVTVSVWQAVRATNAEAKATEQLALTRKAEEEARQAVDKFFVVVSESKLLNVPGLQPLRKELLESAQEYYQKFLHRHSDDPNLRAELGKTWFRVGLITNDVGSKPDALAAYRKGRDMQEELLREQPVDAQRQRDLADTYWNLGELERWSGQNAPAHRSYERSRDLCDRLVRAHPDVPEYRNALAKSYAGLGELYRFTDRNLEAARAYGLARDLGETLVRQHSDNAAFQRDLADICRRFGEMRLELQQYAEALASLQRATVLLGQLVQRKPPYPEDQYLLGWSHTKVARCQQALGEYSLALRTCSQARDILDKLVRENPTVTEYRNGLSSSYVALGNVQRAAGQWAESLASLQQACGELEKIALEHPTIGVYHLNLVRLYQNLAEAQTLRKQPAEAIRVYQKARAHLEKLVKESPTVPDYEFELARCYWWLGKATMATSDSVAASRYFKQAFDALANLTLQHADRAGFHNLLAWYLATCPDPQLRDGIRAVAAARNAQALTPNSGNYANTLGVAYYRAGDWKAAIATFEMAMELREGGNSEDYFFLAMAHWHIDRKEPARQWYAKAVEWMTKHNPEDEELKSFRAEAAALLGVPVAK